MSPEAAETLALNALAWLVAEDDLLPVFLGATGTSQDMIRENAANADFLAAVLDFLTMDDAWVMRFCDAQNLPYETPMRARMALPGGQETQWT